MKILHTADWHIGTFRSPVKDGVNLRTEDTKRCLDELVRVAGEERPDYSIVSGDIFHVGRLWSDRCCEEIVTAFHYIRELAAASKQVIVMRGTPNHDGAGQFNVLSEMFADCRNVHIVTAPQVLAFDDVDIAVLPGFDKGAYRAKFPGLSNDEENTAFTQELANIVTGLKAQCGPGKASVLMAHYTVPGCNAQSGQAMMLAQFEPVIPQEALMAAGYDLVALGHIHRPQRILSQDWFYSGAINAMNFNDEGQERGFWMHHFKENAFGGAGMRLADSYFFKTPVREFLTINLVNEDVSQINIGGIDMVAAMKWAGRIEGKIVRVHYSCSVENAKAYKMNEAVLERSLMENGAFMLWENLPDRIEEFANRTGLAKTTDPEENLVKYLEEKQVDPEKVQELVLKARPIIAAAEASRGAAVGTGAFEPVEITVKNYRNYEEETFNFEDITFCTINGQNGAGKSSLFMDAIIDCLFEEPREGVIKDDAGKSPWLRNDEKARSGSIMFTFRIGEKEYRVTRTRARSGKGTLNIAEFADGEWKDRSRERYNDTQQEIVDILGMDSFTFKSCALIMQDQYGLFLQAKPEERVEVLGILLGLGVYQAMEKFSADKAKVNGAKGRELKQEIEIHNRTIAEFGKPDEELETCKAQLAGYESSLQAKAAERDEQKLDFANRQAAAERWAKLLTSIDSLKRKKAEAEQNRAAQQEIIDSSATILGEWEEIKEKVSEHKALLERKMELSGESALYSAKKREVEDFARQAADEYESIDAYKKKIGQKESELSWAQPTEHDAVVKEKAAEHGRQKKLLEEAYEKERAYRTVEQKLTGARHAMQQLAEQHDASMRRLQLKEEGLKKKAELLSNVECVDIDNAKCGFLADAISAKQELEEYPELYAGKKKDYEEQAAPIQQQISELEKELSEMDFDAGTVAGISKKVSELEPYAGQLETIKQREGRADLLKAEIKHLESSQHEAEKRLSEIRLKGTEAEKERNRYAKAFEEHGKVQDAIAALEPWLEKEKQLPVAEERNLTAKKRVSELAKELMDIDADISGKQAEISKEAIAMSGMDELAGAVAKLNADVDVLNSRIKEKQMEVGALQQKTGQIAKLRKEIAALQEQQAGYAKETADYETLKAAFSQSGVPHQIIRSIIPQLETISSTILGQMTGGKMGVEFRLERLQKNGKEKVSLDIYIEEHGKSVLPYLSKSGGEKVKSSLSVILALAEIKSFSAGIQLGMLFIDEPPFLDGDGIQAYCDALETIQGRYRNIKIMAITHDPTMKARFPQNLDVVKTENGSRVIY